MNVPVVFVLIVKHGEHLHHSTVVTLEVLVTGRFIGAYRGYAHIQTLVECCR